VVINDSGITEIYPGYLNDVLTLVS